MRRWMLGLVLAACSRSAAPPPRPPTAGPVPPAPAAAPDVFPERIAGIPAEAAVVVLVPSFAAFQLGLFLPDAVAARLLEDLDRFLAGRTGLSLGKMRGGAIFVLADG